MTDAERLAGLIETVEQVARRLATDKHDSAYESQQLRLAVEKFRK